MNNSKGRERMSARSYLRMAASAGTHSLTDAMACLECIWHGRVAQRRLNWLMAAGLVAADVLAPTGWAA